MDADSIVARARERAQLRTFDSDSFYEGLRHLLEDIDENPYITQEGRLALGEVAVGLLANRLKVAEFRRTHAELCDRPITAPVFIIGMPRTGTTLVSHLMALDSGHRSLLRWEAFQSAPPAAQGCLYTDPRCLAMKAADAHAVNSPSSIHVERADLPIECIVVTAHDFRSILWPGMVEAPRYQQWLLRTDMREAYRYHKRTLQVLQCYTPGRWILKAPSHALFLDTILEIYPDARFVWTHRDPFRAMASVCSLTATSRRLFSTIDEMSLGPQVSELFRQHVVRPMAWEARSASASIYHLHYERLLIDPIEAMRGLYAWLGVSLSQVVQTRMLEWMRENPKGRFGRHDYDLARFGLSKAVLEPHFRDYLQRYRVATEVSADDGRG